MNEAQRRVLDVMEYNNNVLLFADKSREIVGIENYTYSIDWNNSLAAGIYIDATSPRSFQIIMDSDSDFVLTSLAGAACANQTNAIAGGQQRVHMNPALLMQITNLSSGRTFFNSAVAMPLATGFGGFPFLFPSPRVIKPRSTLKFDFSTATTQAGGANFRGVFLALHGAKIFYR